MCGRFTLRTPQNRLVAQFLLAPVDTLTLKPRYNIAPTQPVAIVRADPHTSGTRGLSLARWGLIPSWAKDPSIGNRMINARAETVARKPSFRSAFAQRRCLVLADGYFEWRRCAEQKVKQPYYFVAKSGRAMAFAGLWEQWRAPDGTAVESTVVITTTANELTAQTHDRMPVILDESGIEQWLAPTLTESGPLQRLLLPCPADKLEAIPVSRLVNSPSNEKPECIEPIAEPLC